MQCGQSWELFDMTQGKPIATYAKQPGEAWNKHIRAFKSGPPSRTGQRFIKIKVIKVITLDIFSQMLLQSHPVVISKKKLLQCKNCDRY